MLNLAKINKQYSIPVFDKEKKEIDAINLQAFLSNKSYVLKLFFNQTKLSVIEQIKNIKKQDFELHNYSIKNLKHYFYESFDNLVEEEQIIVKRLLENELLKTIFNIKENMIRIWAEKNLNYIQLIDRLTLWQKDTYEHSLQEVKDFAQKIIWLKNNNIQDRLSLA